MRARRAAGVRASMASRSSTPPWTVRRPRPGEGERLAELYREGFAERVRRWHRPTFRFGETLVADVGGVIVGFGCAEPAGPEIDGQLAYLDPRDRALFASLAALGQPHEPAAVELFTDEAVRRAPSDALMTAITTDRTVRRCGVAEAIVDAWVELGARRGWRRMFAQCVDRSGSRELFGGLGFAPLVHLAHHYADGTGMTLMVRALPPR